MKINSLCVVFFLSTFFIFNPFSTASRGKKPTFHIINRLAHRGNIDPIKRVYLSMMIERIRKDNPNFDITDNVDFRAAINDIHQRFLSIAPTGNDPLLTWQEEVSIHTPALHDTPHYHIRSFNIAPFRAELIADVLIKKIGSNSVSEDVRQNLIKMAQTPAYQSKVGLALLELARTALDYDITHEPEEAITQYFPQYYSIHFRKPVFQHIDFIKIIHFVDKIAGIQLETINNENPPAENVLLELAENLHKIRTLPLPERIQIMNIISTFNERLNTKIMNYDIKILPYLRTSNINSLPGIETALNFALAIHVIGEKNITKGNFVASLRQAKKRILGYFHHHDNLQFDPSSYFYVLEPPNIPSF